MNDSNKINSDESSISSANTETLLMMVNLGFNKISSDNLKPLTNSIREAFEFEFKQFIANMSSKIENSFSKMATASNIESSGESNVTKSIEKNIEATIVGFSDSAIDKISSVIAKGNTKTDTSETISKAIGKSLGIAKGSTKKDTSETISKAIGKSLGFESGGGEFSVGGVLKKLFNIAVGISIKLTVVSATFSIIMWILEKIQAAFEAEMRIYREYSNRFGSTSYADIQQSKKLTAHKIDGYLNMDKIYEFFTSNSDLLQNLSMRLTEIGKSTDILSKYISHYAAAVLKGAKATGVAEEAILSISSMLQRTTFLIKHDIYELSKDTSQIISNIVDNYTIGLAQISRDSRNEVQNAFKEYKEYLALTNQYTANEQIISERFNQFARISSALFGAEGGGKFMSGLMNMAKNPGPYYEFAKKLMDMIAGGKYTENSLQEELKNFIEIISSQASSVFSSADHQFMADALLQSPLFNQFSPSVLLRMKELLESNSLTTDNLNELLEKQQTISIQEMLEESTSPFDRIINLIEKIIYIAVEVAMPAIRNITKLINYLVDMFRVKLWSSVKNLFGGGDTDYELEYKNKIKESQDVSLKSQYVAYEMSKNLSNAIKEKELEFKKKLIQNAVTYLKNVGGFTQEQIAALGQNPEELLQTALKHDKKNKAFKKILKAKMEKFYSEISLQFGAGSDWWRSQMDLYSEFGADSKKVEEMLKQGLLSRKLNIKEFSQLGKVVSPIKNKPFLYKNYEDAKRFIRERSVDGKRQKYFIYEGREIPLEFTKLNENEFELKSKDGIIHFRVNEKKNEGIYIEEEEPNSQSTPPTSSTSTTPAKYTPTTPTSSTPTTPVKYTSTTPTSSTTTTTPTTPTNSPPTTPISYQPQVSTNTIVVKLDESQIRNITDNIVYFSSIIMQSQSQQLG